jgi:polyhydroxyalkanoate synthesis regulator phasin
MGRSVDTKRPNACRLSIFLLSVLVAGVLLSWLCRVRSAVPVLDFLSGATFHFCHVVCTPFRLIRDFYNLIPTPFVQSDSSDEAPFPVTFDRPIVLVEHKISDVSDLIVQLGDITGSQRQLLEELQRLSDDFDELLAKDLSAELADPQKIQEFYSEANVATAVKELVSDFCAKHATIREITMKETRGKAGHFSFTSPGAVQSFHIQKITFGPVPPAMTIRIGLRLKAKEVFSVDHRLSATSETDVQISPLQMFDEVTMEIVEGEKAARIPDFKLFEPLRLIV